MADRPQKHPVLKIHHMKDYNSKQLKSLAGKTVKSVKVHNAHGEVLSLLFTDHTTLIVCSTHGLSVEHGVADDPNDIAVFVDGVAV